jgi:hypothetical protein
MIDSGYVQAHTAPVRPIFLFRHKKQAGDSFFVGRVAYLPMPLAESAKRDSNLTDCALARQINSSRLSKSSTHFENSPATTAIMFAFCRMAT